MNAELTVAAASCVVLAVGHTTIGLRWVLLGVERERLPSTPFGPSSGTVVMVRVTWYFVSVALVAIAGLLFILAETTVRDPRTLLLRWVTAMFLAAPAMVMWVARRRPRSLLRLPVWTLYVVIAVACWQATL